jgi:hypothetical protein
MRKIAPDNGPVRGSWPEEICRAVDLDGAELRRFAGMIGAWSESLFTGLDLSREVQCFGERYPERLLFARDHSGVRGFLAYHPEYHRMVWGAIKPEPGDAIVFQSLFQALERIAPGEQLLVRFHTVYRRVTDLLLENGYEVACDMDCFLLQGYEGNYVASNDGLLLRCWID